MTTGVTDNVKLEKLNVAELNSDSRLAATCQELKIYRLI